MATYSVVLRIEAKAEFAAIPFPHRRQVNQAIYKLMANPRPTGSELIEGVLHKLTVHGWQLAYEVDDDRFVVTIVTFRKVD
jgi:hypothetical protein